MPDKRDWLHLCNEFGVSTEDFRMQHCSRCLQQECTRSLHGKARFDERVATWEQRLFDEVPRMDEADPRFKILRSKKFVEIDPGPAPEIGRGAWLDPRDLTDSVALVDAPETPKVLEPEPPEPEAPKITPVRASPINTPNQPGQMIGGKNRPVLAPKADPWAPKKEAPPSKDPVVKPGARIRFGD